jgi:hypothetical protein
MSFPEEPEVPGGIPGCIPLPEFGAGDGIPIYDHLN